MVSSSDYERLKAKQQQQQQPVGTLSGDELKIKNFNQRKIEDKNAAKINHLYEDRSETPLPHDPHLNSKPLNRVFSESSDGKVQKSDEQKMQQKIDDENTERDLWEYLTKKITPIFQSAGFSSSQEERQKIKAVLILLKELPYVIIKNDKLVIYNHEMLIESIKLLLSDDLQTVPHDVEIDVLIRAMVEAGITKELITNAELAKKLDLYKSQNNDEDDDDNSHGDDYGDDDDDDDDDDEDYNTPRYTPRRSPSLPPPGPGKQSQPPQRLGKQSRPPRGPGKQSQPPQGPGRQSRPPRVVEGSEPSLDGVRRRIQFPTAAGRRRSKTVGQIPGPEETLRATTSNNERTGARAPTPKSRENYPGSPPFRSTRAKKLEKNKRVEQNEQQQYGLGPGSHVNDQRGQQRAKRKWLEWD